MYRKNCDKCIRPSFSSCETGEWFCPICGNDLSNYPSFDAATFDRINGKNITHLKKIHYYKSVKTEV